MLAKPLAACTHLSWTVSQLFEPQVQKNRSFHVPQPTFLFPLEKAAARQSPNCIKKTKKNKIKLADWILTPYNVARSWHWFRQVTAPCYVACGSRIVTVNSPSGSTLQCNTWLWDDRSYHWIRQVATPCSVAGGSRMTCHWIRPNVRLWFRFRPYHRSRHVTLHQSAKFYPNRTNLCRKKWRNVDFQDGILDF